MARRLVFTAVAAVVGMAFLMAPATAGSTVTKMRFDLGGHDVEALAQSTGSVSLWSRIGSSWVPIGGATLAVVVDGRPVGTVVTDSTGFASVSVPPDLAPGGHVMKIIYSGDGVYARTQRAQGFSVDSGGEPPSCVSVPDAPTLLAADTTASGEVTLAWSPPANDGGCPITSYNVYRGPDVVGSAGGSATSFVDTGVPSGLHFYTVTAVNDAGESVPSNVIVVST
jgi:hypothetical protein